MQSIGHFVHILGHLQAFSVIFRPVVGDLGTLETMFRKSWLKELSSIFCIAPFHVAIWGKLQPFSGTLSFFKHLFNFWVVFDHYWSCRCLNKKGEDGAV